MNISGIEGLTVIEGPIRRDRMEGTVFALPPGFPTDKYSARWEIKGHAVNEAMQPTAIESIGAMADGWQIYKILKNPKKKLTPEQFKALSKKDQEDYSENVPEFETFERTLGNKVLVLMFRPKALQQALNIAYANQSRILVGEEVDGNKNSVSDDHQGILTNRDLKRFGINEGDEQGYLKTTPIARPTEAATLVV